MVEEIKVDMDNAIRLRDGSYVGFMPKDYNIYLNKSTIYYGASGTGKSTLIREQMYILKDHIPKIVVYAPTNNVNHTYTGIVPSKFIHSTVTRAKIEKLWNSQVRKAEAYAIVNNFDNLKLLVEYMKEVNSLMPYYQKINQIDYRINQFEINEIEKTKNHPTLNPADKKDQIANIKMRAKTKKVEIYKSTLLQHRKELVPHILDEHHAKLLQLLDIDPKLYVIFDDCMEELSNIAKSYGKDTNPVLNQLFTQGRWRYITIAIAAQDDTKILPTLRKNAFISVFTEQECCLHFMENKSNSIGKEKRNRAAMICTDIFSGHGNKKNFKKFVYCRSSDPASCFCYTIADVYDDFKCGDAEQWEISARYEKSAAKRQREFISQIK